MAWVSRTIIVHDAAVAAVRAACEALAGAGGSGMYTVPLSPTGNLPATHWASSGAIEDSFAHLLESPDALAAVATAAGLDPTPLLAIIADSDITDMELEPWLAVLARLGLQVILSDASANE